MPEPGDGQFLIAPQAGLRPVGRRRDRGAVIFEPQFEEAAAVLAGILRIYSGGPSDSYQYHATSVDEAICPSRANRNVSDNARDSFSVLTRVQSSAAQGSG